MVPIVDTLLTCARQNIAFRGHRGEAGVVSATGVDPTENDGNFRELLRYRIRSGDKTLQSHGMYCKECHVSVTGYTEQRTQCCWRSSS